MIRTRIALTIAAGTAWAVPAAAQFSQEVLRYQASQAECRHAFERHTANRCDAACTARAEAVRQRCVTTAERRYQRVLRRVMETRP